MNIFPMPCHASDSLGVALWPVYKASTPIVLFALFYGILFQFVTLIPAQYSSPIIFLVYSFFVYYYTQGTTPW